MVRITTTTASASASFLLLLISDVSNAFTVQTLRTNTPRILKNNNNNYLPRGNTVSLLNAQQTEEEEQTSEDERKQDVRDAASDALTSVGWAPPMMDAELTSDDPFVKRINDQIQAESGVNLDELLNPAKVRFWIWKRIWFHRGIGGRKFCYCLEKSFFVEKLQYLS
jgi:flagellar hook-associated protein FlgK